MTAMAGTIFSATREMDWSPPRVTAATRTVSTAAVASTGMPAVMRVISTMEFTCAKVPMPKKATSTPKMAKAVPRGFHFSPRPFLM